MSEPWFWIAVYLYAVGAGLTLKIWPGRYFRPDFWDITCALLWPVTVPAAPIINGGVKVYKKMRKG